MAKKYKLEVKLEEAVEKIGNSLSYFVVKFADYWFTKPKSKAERDYKMFELSLFGGWILINIAGFLWLKGR